MYEIVLHDCIFKGLVIFVNQRDLNWYVWFYIIVEGYLFCPEAEKIVLLVHVAFLLQVIKTT